MLAAIERSLRPGGLFVAVHDMSPILAILDGNEVHDLLKCKTGLATDLSSIEELGAGRPYRLNRFVKSAATEVDQALG